MTAAGRSPDQSFCTRGSRSLSEAPLAVKVWKSEPGLACQSHQEDWRRNIGRPVLDVGAGDDLIGTKFVVRMISG